MHPQLTDWFDRYLLNQMNDEEKREFEQSLRDNPQLKSEFDQYERFIHSFQAYHQHAELRDKFEEWYVDQARSGSSTKKLWWNVSYVAASVALIVTIAGIWFYETLKRESNKQHVEITYLKKELKEIQNQQNHLVKNIQQMNRKQYAPANAQSTGFMIYPQYLITTYHSIQGADSVFIENAEHPRTEAKVVYVNKQLDVALLYAPTISSPNVPLYVYNQILYPGADVFTLGYPTSQLVYNKGYISAINGYNDDSAYYQITLPLNPGNSGGPLFDNKGNLIGVIVSKNTTMEGVAFALKSITLYTLKDSLPSDSIKNVWTKVFRKYSFNYLQKSSAVEKFQSYIFKVYIYQKSL